MPVDDSACQAALDRLILAVNHTNPQIAREGAYAVKGAAQLDAPRLDGDLAESIVVTGPYPTSATSAEAKVGPTVVYGRQRELGGPIDPKPGHRYLAFFWPDGPPYLPHLPDGRVLVRHVHQTGRPYLKPAVAATRRLYLAIARRRWADAIKGAV